MPKVSSKAASAKKPIKPTPKKNTPKKKVVKKQKSAAKAPKSAAKAQKPTMDFGPIAPYNAVFDHKQANRWADFIKANAPAKIYHPHFNTYAIHKGQHPDPVHGAVNVPIYNSTTYAQEQPGKPKSKYDYTRCGNPTHTAFSEALAACDYGKYGMTFSSGCGATSTIMTSLKRGEHLVCSDDVYGGTNRLINKVLKPQYDFDCTFVDMTNLKAVEKAVKPGKTKLMWCETPTNPTMKVCDIAALAKICKKHGIRLVCDNTFATPYLQSPLLLGADVVYHSVTKYVNGHSDVICGAISTNDKEFFERIHFIGKTMGPCLGVLDGYMALRGLKTLGIRVDMASYNAGIVARFLDQHPFVTRVSYPGLESDPGHEVAKKQMRGFGGMITFYIKGGIKQSSAFLTGLKVMILAESLGGVESLAECPAVMTHGSVPPEHRKMLGIDDTLIRLSVGMECITDLLDDVDRALKAAMAVK